MQNETVVDMAILVVTVVDTSAEQENISLLNLTRPRGMVSIVPINTFGAPPYPFLQNADLVPMVKLRFASVSLSDTTAKESRIKISLHGFTFNLAADQMKWINDLAAFAKAPPGVRVLCHSYIVAASLLKFFLQ